MTFCDIPDGLDESTYASVYVLCIGGPLALLLQLEYNLAMENLRAPHNGQLRRRRMQSRPFFL